MTFAIEIDGTTYTTQEALNNKLKNYSGKLDLGWQEIGDTGAEALAAALRDKDCKVTKIDLCGNNIGDDGAKALALALPKSKVTEINLRHNNIGDDGAKALALALPKSQVTQINLGGNTIGEDGAKALADALPKSQVTKINLWNNNIKDDGAKALALALPKSEVTDIGLYGNNIKDDGAKALALALPKSPVTEINLGANNIGDDGAKALAAALGQEGCKVKTIRLDYNNIDSSLKDKIHAMAQLSGDARRAAYAELKQDYPDIQAAEDELKKGVKEPMPISSQSDESNEAFSSQDDVTKAIDGAMDYWQEGYEKKITSIEATVESEQKELVDEWKEKTKDLKKLKDKYDEYKEQCSFHADIPATLANIGGDYREKRDELREIEKHMHRKGGRPNHVKVGIEAGRSIQRVLAAGANIPATGQTQSGSDNQKQKSVIGKIANGLLSLTPRLLAMGSTFAGDAAERMSIADRQRRILQAYDGGRKKFFSDGVSTIDEPVDNSGECPSEIPEEGSVTERIIQEGVMHPYEKFSNIIERISPDQIEKLEDDQLDKLLLSSFNSLNMQAAEGVDSPSAQKALSSFNTLLKKAPESMFHGQGALTGGRLENCLILIKNVLRVNSDSENPQDQAMQLVKLCGDALGTIFDKADENTFNRNDPQTHVIRQTLKDITSFSITIASAASPTDVNATKPLEAMLGAVAKSKVHEEPADEDLLEEVPDSPILMGVDHNTPAERFYAMTDPNDGYTTSHLERIVGETEKRVNRGDLGLLNALVDIAKRDETKPGITKGAEIFSGHDHAFLRGSLRATKNTDEALPPAAIVIARLVSVYKDKDFATGGVFSTQFLKAITSVANKFKDSGPVLR